MSLKDNFNQALKEVLKRDGLVGDDHSKETKKKSELDKYLEPARTASPAETAVKAEEPVPAEIPAPVQAADEKPAETAAPAPEAAAYESPYIKPEQNASQFGTGAYANKTPLSGGSEVKSGVAEPEQGASPFSQFSQYARQSGAAQRGEDSMRSSSYDSRFGGSYGSGQPFGGG